MKLDRGMGSTDFGRGGGSRYGERRMFDHDRTQQTGEDFPGICEVWREAQDPGIQPVRDHLDLIETFHDWSALGNNGLLKLFDFTHHFCQGKHLCPETRVPQSHSLLG